MWLIQLITQGRSLAYLKSVYGVKHDLKKLIFYKASLQMPAAGAPHGQQQSSSAKAARRGGWNARKLSYSTESSFSQHVRKPLLQIKWRQPCVTFVAWHLAPSRLEEEILSVGGLGRKNMQLFKVGRSKKTHWFCEYSAGVYYLKLVPVFHCLLSSNLSSVLCPLTAPSGTLVSFF